MDKLYRIYVNGKPTSHTFKSDKAAHAYVYALKRNDRECEWTGNEYTVRQADYRLNRRNKQARRAFELQEG